MTVNKAGAQVARRPLEGVKVVEFGHVAAGPFATMLLADLGADVVKVESPAGDQMRKWPPLAESPDGEQFSHNFASINRNKRSVVADLKDPSDRERVFQLCLAADVIVENYRPGVLDKLGLGYEALELAHRGVVYCSISGFGQSGEYAQMGAYDVVIQAMSGMMSVTGTPSGELVKSGVPFADFVSGLYAALGVLSWQPLARMESRSFRLDVPMLDCVLATSALQTSEFWGTGVVPTPRGTKHPRNAPYQVFQASDGPFVVAAGNDRLWQKVCTAINDDGTLSGDTRFIEQASRVEHQDCLEQRLNDAFGARDSQHWIASLREHGVPAGPVNTFADIVSDPAVLASGLIRSMPMPVAGETLTTVFPVRVSDSGPRIDYAAPRLGEQNDSVFDEWAI